MLTASRCLQAVSMLYDSIPGNNLMGFTPVYLFVASTNGVAIDSGSGCHHQAIPDGMSWEGPEEEFKQHDGTSASTCAVPITVGWVTHNPR